MLLFHATGTAEVRLVRRLRETRKALRTSRTDVPSEQADDAGCVLAKFKKPDALMRIEVLSVDVLSELYTASQQQLLSPPFLIITHRPVRKDDPSRSADTHTRTTTTTKKMPSGKMFVQKIYIAGAIIYTGKPVRKMCYSHPVLQLLFQKEKKPTTQRMDRTVFIEKQRQGTV